MQKGIAAIVGPGLVGTDLMYKLLRCSRHLRLVYVVGLDPGDGISRAQAAGLVTSVDGVDWLLNQTQLPDVVFDATNARSHVANAPRFEQAGIAAIDLTPSAVGPYCVPAVNQPAGMNVSMVTSGGQASVPVVAAVSRIVPVQYAEVVTTLPSSAVGPGSRTDIDQYTTTTADALVKVGGALDGKAILVLNPGEPPMAMRSTVFCSIPPELVDDEDTRRAISQSIQQAVAELGVPGYQLRSEPQFDEPRDVWNGMARVAAFLQISGAGDYLPPYAGNLDIITSAAVRAGDQMVEACHDRA